MSKRYPKPTNVFEFLNELHHYVDLNDLGLDSNSYIHDHYPEVSSVLAELAAEATPSDRLIDKRIPSFQTYLLHRRKLPNPELFNLYLQTILDLVRTPAEHREHVDKKIGIKKTRADEPEIKTTPYQGDEWVVLFAKDPTVDNLDYFKQLPTDVDQKNISSMGWINSSQYRLTFRNQAPSDATLAYLNISRSQVIQHRVVPPKSPLLTAAEIEQLSARKTWQEIVARVAKGNEDLQQHQATTANVIKRIQVMFDVSEDVATTYYQKSLDYLQHGTAIVLTFCADFLNKKGLADHQPLNAFELSEDYKSETYKAFRIAGEKKLLSLSGIPGTEKLVEENIHVRPRYAALQLFDKKHLPQALSVYGESFIVFNDGVKLNSLFVQADSLKEFKRGTEKVVCTVNNFPLLLEKASDTWLRSLITKVTTGSFPDRFSQQLLSIYVEAWIPSVDILDPRNIQHIHISPTEYILLEKEKRALAQKGLIVTNESDKPTHELCQELISAINHYDSLTCSRLITTYPLLIQLAHDQGVNLLFRAAMVNNMIALELLIKAQRIDLNELNAEGKTLAHIAVENSNAHLIALLKAAGADFRILNGNQETPVMLAKRLGKTDLFPEAQPAASENPTFLRENHLHTGYSAVSKQSWHKPLPTQHNVAEHKENDVVKTRRQP